MHLVDSHYCTDAAKFISVLLLSLKTMLQLELPHVNILSKVDLIETYGRLPMALDFYTNVADLSYLQYHLNQDPFMKRFQQLNEAMCGLIEDFALVGFETLCIQDKESVTKVVRAIDKASGYVFGGLEESNESIFMTAMRAGSEWESSVHDVQERYIDNEDPNEDLYRFAREYKMPKEDEETEGGDTTGAESKLAKRQSEEGELRDGKKRVGFADE